MRVTIKGRPGYRRSDVPKCFAAAAEGKIKTQIERVLSHTAGGRLERMEDVLTADAEARRMAQEEIAKVAGGVAAQVRSA